jgi:pyruvate/2-oxoglutarate dehydrogenase complex dihydrolipoamide dehydrogenase (E3) component
MRDIPEQDWQLLRRLKPVALDRLCARILDEVQRAATAPGRSSHERYLDVFRLIQDRDRIVADAFNGHRRSMARMHITIIRAQGLFTDDEFAQFSQETREGVERALRPS